MKTIKEVKEYIEKLNAAKHKEASQIAEVFNGLEAAQEWDFCDGYITALYDILKFIGE